MNLILKDGTVIEGGSAGLSSNNNLWLWFRGYTLQQTAMMMFDPSKTGKIIAQHGQTSDEFFGYTDCIDLSMNRNGEISVCLRKG